MKGSSFLFERFNGTWLYENEGSTVFYMGQQEEKQLLAGIGIILYYIFSKITIHIFLIGTEKYSALNIRVAGDVSFVIRSSLSA